MHIHNFKYGGNMNINMYFRLRTHRNTHKHTVDIEHCAVASYFNLIHT